MKTKKIFLFSLLISTAFSAPSFAANSEDMADKIKQLEARLEKFEEAFDDIDHYINTEVDKRMAMEMKQISQKESVDFDKLVATTVEQKMAEQIAQIETAAGSNNDVDISLNPAPSFKSKDGGTTFKMDGRIMVDAGFVDEDQANLQDNATDIRYAWLGLKGTIDHDWAYRFLVGLENDSTTVNDAYIAYNGFDGMSLKVGNFKEFQGIEAMSSNLHNTLQERSAATTSFRPLRSLGLASSFYGKNWSVQAGLFGDDPGNTSNEDESYSATGRLVAAPIYNKDKDLLLHLGVSGSYRVPDDATNTLRFRARGDSNVVNTRLVDTGAGTINNVDNYQTYGLEGRFTYGPFALMGEYSTVSVSRENGSQDVDFDGSYLSASYFLTGEQRGYKVKNGTYGRVKPHNPLGDGGTGAWEIAARYSTLDLNDGPVTGGELDSYTFGVNWYPTKNTKLMLNYIKNETDTNGTTPNDEPSYITLRAQLDF